MCDSPFLVAGLLADTVKSLKGIGRGHEFPPEINKVFDVGLKRRKKLWFVCDGHGNMRAQYIRDPLEMLERLAELKERGLITEADYRRAKAALLDELLPE